jgi:hypothetical protein
MCDLKILACKGILRQVFICLRPPLHIVYVYTSILIHTGKGGGGRGEIEPERKGEGQQFTKLGRRN